MVREVEETVLPGVGLRFAFTLSSGRRLSVVVRRDGRYEVSLSGLDDPDTSFVVLDLDLDEARQLAELLGGSEVTRDLAQLQQLGSELTVEWLVVGGEAAGSSLGELHVRGRTGATVVAVVRDGRPMGTPGPDTVLEAQDHAAVLGDHSSIESATQLLSG